MPLYSTAFDCCALLGGAEAAPAEPRRAKPTAELPGRSYHQTASALPNVCFFLPFAATPTLLRLLFFFLVFVPVFIVLVVVKVVIVLVVLVVILLL
jgi:hypothetical protein